MNETGPVLVDYRERGSSIPDALGAAGLDVQLTDLPVGDYVLGHALAVERKGPADLGASIRDGRLFDQAMRLQSAFPQAVLLIEGEPRIAEDAWRGAVCCLVEDGFTVLHSLDAEDSAAWIVRLAKRARRAAPTVRTEGPRRAPRHPSAQAEVMLSIVPGISSSMACSLLAAYGSIEASPPQHPPGCAGTLASVGCVPHASPTHSTASMSRPATVTRNPNDPWPEPDRCAAGSSKDPTTQSPSRSTVAPSRCAQSEVQSTVLSSSTTSPGKSSQKRHLAPTPHHRPDPLNPTAPVARPWRW